jgi:translation initiation factor 4B
MNFSTTRGEIEDFLADCQVTEVRIPEDKLEGKPKGFAYATFETLDGLKKALDLTGRDLAGRPIRISVAEPRKSHSIHDSPFQT